MLTTFQTFDFERTCCRLFQKRVIFTTKVWKVVSMTRFWNNLQQVLTKSKVWKVVNMTRFWNNLQQVRSKSKAYLLQVIPETRHAHYFPNL
jgi:hypothetical protein